MAVSPVSVAKKVADKFGVFERFRRELQYERIEDFLPYRAFDPETGIYILDHGKETRIGWFFVSENVISPSSNLLKEFESLVSALPPKSTLQIAFAMLPYLGPLLDLFKSLRKERLSPASSYPEDRKKLLRRMIEEKAKLHEQLCYGDRTEKSYPYLLKRQKLYFSFTVSPKETPTEEILRARDKTRVILSSMGFHPEDGTPDDLLELLWFLLLPRETVEPPTDSFSTLPALRGDPVPERFVPLSYFLIPPSIGVRFESDHAVTSEGRYLSSISYRHYPEKVSPGAFDALLGDPWKPIAQLPYSYCHVLNVLVPEQSAIKGEIGKKHAVAAWQSFGPMAKFVPKTGKLKQDYEELLFRGEKEHILKAYLHTLVLADSREELEEAVSSFITHAKRYGFFPVRDRFVLGPLLFNSLPMGLYPDEAPRLFRQRTLSSSMCACLAPVHGDGKRFGSPILLFTTRRGFVFAGDIFASPQGYNGLIFGSTGGGKSFFMNELASSYFSAGGKIIIVDVGRSYQKLCEVLGGEYITFSRDSHININPFAHLSTDPEEFKEDIEMLKDFLEMMAAPKRGFDDFQKGALSEVLIETIQKYKQETTFDLIAEKLLRHRDQRVRDIAVMLTPWCKGGENHRWVASGRPIDFESDFIVIEMEDLMSRPALQKVAVFYFMYRISFDFLQKTLRDPSFKKKPKFLFIDEAWESIKAGNADLIERAYRRFRKTGSGCWIITQSPTDLEGTPVADALWNNANYVVMLRTESFDKSRVKDRLSPYALEAVATLQTVKGRFSEIYFRTPFGEDVVRFYAPRFTQLVYTTDPMETSFIEEKRKQGLSYADAIDALLKEEEEKHARA